MGLDIHLFRDENEGVEKIRESQRRRFASVELVDEVTRLYKEWRQRQFELDNLKKDLNQISKEVGKLKISGEDATEKIKSSVECKQCIAAKESEVQEAKDLFSSKLDMIGNIVHDSVPIDNDEANNLVVRESGETRAEPWLKNHVELVKLLGIADLEKGANVAGGRGYYLKGVGVRLNQALINFGLQYLEKRNYTLLQTPFFMQKGTMAKCAQLAQFDEELYKVTGEGDDKYLIATAEQPLCSYHLGDWIHPAQLPIRYAGYSTCFRKEAGSHGRDTLGIFRTHQFEKVEQFCITSPADSWQMHEEMIKNSEDFYKELNLPYRVVSIVSGALNDAAAKKYDLEAHFPASNTYRELVSCSNCTDFQSRKLEIRFGQKKSNAQAKEYCHLLNSTLTATERTMCCLLENYQTEDGVEIPAALQPFMDGLTFIPFEGKGKRSTYPSAGQPFGDGQHNCTVGFGEDKEYEDVGGFCILKTQVPLYKQIWLKYGHIPTNKVMPVSSNATLVMLVKDLMNSIIDMHQCRYVELSYERFKCWEEMLKMAERLEFNIRWLQERLDSVKKGLGEMPEFGDNLVLDGLF